MKGREVEVKILKAVFSGTTEPCAEHGCYGVSTLGDEPGGASGDEDDGGSSRYELECETLLRVDAKPREEGPAGVIDYEGHGLDNIRVEEGLETILHELVVRGEELLRGLVPAVRTHGFHFLLMPFGVGTRVSRRLNCIDWDGSDGSRGASRHSRYKLARFFLCFSMADGGDDETFESAIEWSFDVDLSREISTKELLKLVAWAMAPLAADGEAMQMDVEEEDGRVVVVVGRDDDEPFEEGDEVLTYESVEFELISNAIQVTLLADEDAEAPVERLMASLQERADEIF